MKCGVCGANIDNGVCTGCGRKYYSKGDVLVVHRGDTTSLYFADSMKKAQIETLSREMGRFVSLTFDNEGPAAKESVVTAPQRVAEPVQPVSVEYEEPKQEAPSYELVKSEVVSVQDTVPVKSTSAPVIDIEPNIEPTIEPTAQADQKAQTALDWNPQGVIAEPVEESSPVGIGWDLESFNTVAVDSKEGMGEVSLGTMREPIVEKETSKRRGILNNANMKVALIIVALIAVLGIILGSDLLSTAYSNGSGSVSGVWETGGGPVENTLATRFVVTNSNNYIWLCIDIAGNWTNHGQGSLSVLGEHSIIINGTEASYTRDNNVLALEADNPSDSLIFKLVGKTDKEKDAIYDAAYLLYSNYVVGIIDDVQTISSDVWGSATDYDTLGTLADRQAESEYKYVKELQKGEILNLFDKQIESFESETVNYSGVEKTEIESLISSFQSLQILLSTLSSSNHHTELWDSLSCVKTALSELAISFYGN